MATEKIKLFELDVNYDDVLKDNAKLLEKLVALKNEQKELNKKITDTKNATDAERQAFVSNQAALKNVTSQYNQNNKVLQSLNDTQLNNITTVEQAKKALTATGTLWARQTKLEGENSESSKRLAKRKLELTERLKKLESATGDNTRKVGSYTKAIKEASKGNRIFSFSLKDTIAQFTAGFGIIAGIRSFIGTLKDATARIKDFDKAMQNMAGIANLTRSELKLVEKGIKEVAGESVKTSNEVALLATNLFALGKTKTEVIKLLKPVNDLSIALQTTSENAAEFLGQQLNAFGKGADSAQMFADTIANIRSSTALNFQKMADAFGFLSPTVKALGLTIGDAGAILGTLHDNGIKAARAGRLMSSSFARLIDDGLTLKDALAAVNDSTDKVKTASKLFGKESFTLGLILAENIDKTKMLSNEFNEMSEGSLKRLTDEQLKSLDAQAKIVDSTWEKFILNLDSGNGVISTLISNFYKLKINLIETFDEINKINYDAGVGSNIGLFFLRLFGYGDEAQKSAKERINFIEELTLKEAQETLDSQKRLLQEATDAEDKFTQLRTQNVISLIEKRIKEINDLEEQAENDEVISHQKKLDNLIKYLDDSYNAEIVINKEKEKEKEKEKKIQSENDIKNAEYELAVYKLQNESKLESDKELTADLIEEEVNRLKIIATKENEINQQKYESGLIDKQEYEFQKLQLDTDYSNAYLELIDETILQADEKNQEAIQKGKD
ncbi:phage tail tape measure protein, partial [Candidatus Woesearchaeota archaeon]|nr:phage tail tape measure protein [Candidatus Woesearchaeota archaeon]